VQGLASCAGAACTFSHPLLLPLLHEYVPVPTGVDEGAFYSCLGCYSDRIDLTAWSDTGFAVDFQERVVLPGRRASELLRDYPYLTRLFTMLSPAEMTEDPMFHQRADLPEVPAQRLASRAVVGEIGFQVPGAHLVVLTDDGSWPVFETSMPWVERVEEIPASGAVIELVDNGTLIDLLLEDHNRAQGWDEDACGSPGGNSGGGSGGSGGGTIGGNGGGGSGGEKLTDEDRMTAGGGCGCSVPRGGGAGSLAMALALGALVARGRRRRAEPCA
jgi:MYXO-CTERM domain-containing protein